VGPTVETQNHRCGFLQFWRRLSTPYTFECPVAAVTYDLLYAHSLQDSNLLSFFIKRRNSKPSCLGSSGTELLPKTYFGEYRVRFLGEQRLVSAHAFTHESD